MSPFRELLTEFRSLTERYGQALLALGEARGEVAALRTRVELLEARMDLRLPSTRPASTVAWEIPGSPPQQEQAAEPAADLPPELPASDELAAEAAPAEPVEADFEPEPMEPMEPTLDVEVPVEPEPAPPAPPAPARAKPSASRKRRAESKRKKIKGGRSALVGIAEALARADDPTLAELPGGTETAEAMAALQRDVEASGPDEEAVAELPAEIVDVVPEGLEPTAEPVLEPMEEEPPELFTEASMPAISVPAAGLVADADEALLGEEVAAPDVIEVSYVTLADEAVDAPVEEAVESDTVTTAEEPAAEETPAFEVPAEGVIADAAAALDEPITAHDAEPTEAVLAEPETAEAEPVEPEPPDVPAQPEGTHELLAAPDSPYSADVVEPDWFADGDFTWLEAAQAESSQQSAEAPPVEEQAAPESNVELDQTADVDLMPSGEVAPPPEQAAAPQDGFEPSASQELEAEEEARAAIQDAFQETAQDTPDEFREPAPEPEATEPAEDAIQEAFAEPAPEPETSQAVAEPPMEPFEEPEPEPAPAEPAQDAIQDAFGEAEMEPMPEQEMPGSTAADQVIPAFAEPLEEPPLPAEEPSAEDRGSGEVAEEPSVQEARESLEQPQDEGPLAGQEPEQAPAAPRGEEELMWLGDEFEAAGIEVAAQGWRSADAPMAPQVSLDAPTLELSDAELSQLAEDEGWDAAEVEAIRRLLGRPTPPDGPSADAPPIGTLEPPAPPAPDEAAPPGAIAQSEPPAAPRHAMSMSDPQWLRGRRGPAATAYRRLRRLFPG